MGIFDIFNEITREFWGELDELSNEFGKVVARENADVKKEDEKSGKEDYSSYECSKKDTYVNGEHVSHEEKVWKDGKCVRDEHYCKEGTIGSAENKKIEGSCCNGGKQCKCADSRVKKDGGVEYTIEFDDEDDVVWLKEKNESLRKSVNQLCADAEKDRNEIQRLRAENEKLRNTMAKLSEVMKGH